MRYSRYPGIFGLFLRWNWRGYIPLCGYVLVFMVMFMVNVYLWEELVACRRGYFGSLFILQFRSGFSGKSDSIFG